MNTCSRPAWAPRVSRYEIARLYHTDARGIRDEDLVNEVGYGLFARAQDCLTVTEATRGRIKCPQCDTIIFRKKAKSKKEAKEEALICSSCPWQLQWAEYFRSYRQKHLIAAGMVPYLHEFVRQWPRAIGYAEKILLVDAIIHRFHGELAGDSGASGAVNLIGGNRPEVLAFLNELTYGTVSSPGLATNRDRWVEKFQHFSGGVWKKPSLDEITKAHRWEGHGKLQYDESKKGQQGAAEERDKPY